MFAKREKSRFTSRSELKPIVSLIEELRVKKNQLKHIADNSNIGSIDYKKHAILEDMLIKFNELIVKYNKNAKLGRSREDELTEINILLVDFALVIGHLKEKELEILCTPRDNKRLYLNYMFHYGSMGTGAVVGTVIGGPLLGLGLLFSGGVASTVSI